MIKLIESIKKVGEFISSKKNSDLCIITEYEPDHNLLNDSDLLANWDLMNDWMKIQSGFVNANFYKRISRDTTYKYMTFANWNILIDTSNIVRDSNLFNKITVNKIKQKT